MADLWQRKWALSPRWLGLVLLAVLGWPVAISWISLLAARSFSENVVPIGAALLLLAGVWQSLRQCRLRNFFGSDPAAAPSLAGLGFFVLAVLGYAVADFYSVQSILWVSYIALLAGYAWALRGTAFFLRWLPVALFSGFLLPTVNAEIHMAISLPLQVASAQLAALVAGIFLPVSSSDTLISVGENALQVTPACSGLQSWMGFVFAGLLWQLFEGARPRFLAFLIPGAMLLSLLLNSLRLAITVLAAGWFSLDQAIALHTNLDFILFPSGLLIVWMVASRWFGEEKITVAPADTNAANAVLPLNKPWISRSAMILLGLLIAGHWLINTPLQTMEPLTQLPLRLDGWQGHDVPLTVEEQRAYGSARVINREYAPISTESDHSADDPVLWMKVLQSSKIADIHNFYGCLMVQGIRPKQITVLHYKTAQGTLHATLMEFEYEGDRYYSVLWHQWGGQTASNRWQWYRAVLTERLQHRTHDWKLVKLVMPETAETPAQREQELQTLTHFASSVYSELATQRQNGMSVNLPDK